ncbi:MAG: carbon-nitrogen hydrolase family protein [Betaproteobacteria bacterium]|nr:carbon-nitrogen hydrolase family protein [Betaproteobacteria bacterium]
MTQPYQAAVVQTLAKLGDIDANIALLRDYTREAVRQGAKLVVFPECMNTGYLFDSAGYCEAVAETVDGPFVNAMADLAKQYGLHIASGVTERDAPSGKIYNSGVLIGPKGDLLVHYQKQFLATHDQNWFEFGVRGCPVADTELGRIGLLICFDGRIPEIARCLALQGAEVVVDMANFFAMDQAEMWVPARAFENGVYFVAATKAGVERSIYYPGGSTIAAPTGEVLARMPYDRHGVASARIDPASARAKGWLGGGDRFRDRRVDAYGLLAKPFAGSPAARALEEPLVPEKSVTKVAAVQAHATPADPAGREALEMADHTAKLGAQLIVLPLHANSPTWAPDATEARAAASKSAAVSAEAARIAKQYGRHVVLPLIVETGASLAIEAHLIGPEGTVVGRYRQVHTHPVLESWALPGDAFPVFDTPVGRIGMLLGYDGLFPESARLLALAGADIVAYASAWQHRFERELLAVPKAEDNRVYVVCANRNDSPYPGGSFVIPPNGFPHWDVNVSAPPVGRVGAVMPTFAHLALSREKLMIPKVDMLRNRLVQTYAPLVATAKAA